MTFGLPLIHAILFLSLSLTKTTKQLEQTRKTLSVDFAKQGNDSRPNLSPQMRTIRMEHVTQMVHFLKAILSMDGS